jgi:hypothetical protein
MVERVKRRTRRPVVATADEVIRVMTSAFGVEESEREDIEARKFAVEPAYVRVNAGVTKNMGNYESLRVDVSITVPCYTEEVDDVQARVSDRVADLLADELKKYEVE